METHDEEILGQMDKIDMGVYKQAVDHALRDFQITPALPSRRTFLLRATVTKHHDLDASHPADAPHVLHPSFDALVRYEFEPILPSCSTLTVDQVRRQASI